MSRSNTVKIGNLGGVICAVCASKKRKNAQQFPSSGGVPNGRGGRSTRPLDTQTRPPLPLRRRGIIRTLTLAALLIFALPTANAADLIWNGGVEWNGQDNTWGDHSGGWVQKDDELTAATFGVGDNAYFTGNALDPNTGIGTVYINNNGASPNNVNVTGGKYIFERDVDGGPSLEPEGDLNISGDGTTLTLPYLRYLNAFANINIDEGSLLEVQSFNLSGGPYRGAVINNNGTLKLYTDDSNFLYFDRIITGTGSVEIMQDIILRGANTYTGGTTVAENATLTGALPNNGNLTLTNNAKYNLGSADRTIAGLENTGLSEINLGSNTLTINGTSIINGVLSSTGTGKVEFNGDIEIADGGSIQNMALTIADNKTGSLSVSMGKK